MKIENLAVNQLRTVSAEMITNAKSGHPGIALGGAPIFFGLYEYALKFDNKNPNYFNRDRFVMSAGHGSSIVYATLNLFGFNVKTEDLKNFRQLNSITPGHPEKNLTPGVDCSTGPLGQGIANAVGMAIAEKHLEAKYNKDDIKIFNNHVYCFSGDGCLMEGISYESLCLAGTLKLNNFTLIYDKNNITIESDTKSNFDINFKSYFEALGFKVFEIKNGNDSKVIGTTLLKCKKSQLPTVVIVNTKIGYGSELEGSEKSHGTPLNEVQLQNLKQKLEVTTEPFTFDDLVINLANKANIRNRKIIEFENEQAKLYQEKYPSEYAEIFEDKNEEKRVEEICKELAKTNFTKNASRDMAYEGLQFIASKFPNLIGGCADLASSTKAFIKDTTYISKEDFSGRNIHFGIREHSMGAICNGIATYNLKTFASTFMSFSNYMNPSIRMACLDELPVLYIFSHDSFMVGEDGPTHQSIEQLATLRSTPNLQVFRPYNHDEMKAAYIHYIKTNLPTVISTSKNEVENIPSGVNEALRGGYIFKNETKKLHVIIVASGMEVDTALKVDKILKENRIDSRIVSMPNVNLYASQTKNYTSRVIPPECDKIVIIEPSSANSWHKIGGREALYITKDTFGKSAKAKDLVKEFEFDENSIAEKIINYVKK